MGFSRLEFGYFGGEGPLGIVHHVGRLAPGARHFADRLLRENRQDWAAVVAEGVEMAGLMEDLS